MEMKPTKEISSTEKEVAPVKGEPLEEVEDTSTGSNVLPVAIGSGNNRIIDSVLSTGIDVNITGGNISLAGASTDESLSSLSASGDCFDPYKDPSMGGLVVIEEVNCDEYDETEQANPEPSDQSSISSNAPSSSQMSDAAGEKAGATLGTSQPKSSSAAVSQSVSSQQPSLKRGLPAQSPGKATRSRQQPSLIALNCTEENCTQLVESKEALKSHLLRAHAIQHFRCLEKNCGQSFPTQDDLTEHFRWHLVNRKLKIVDKQYRWSCSGCDKLYTSHQSLYAHNYTDHCKGIFQCRVVNCQFEGETILEVLHHKKLSPCPLIKKSGPPSEAFPPLE